MAQDEDTFRGVQRGFGLQIYDQKKASTKTPSPPSRAYCPGYVQADVHSLCRVRLRNTVLRFYFFTTSVLTDVPMISGDVTTLSTICTEGLLASFRSRIAARPRNEKMRWTLHRFTQGPQFVSQRMAMLPYKGAALRQVIVRMRSRQSLARMVSKGNNNSGTLVQGTGEEVEVSEYLVLQRRMLRNEEGPWLIWGTTSETEPAMILGSKSIKPAVAARS